MDLSYLTIRTLLSFKCLIGLVAELTEQDITLHFHCWLKSISLPSSRPHQGFSASVYTRPQHISSAVSALSLISLYVAVSFLSWQTHFMQLSAVKPVKQQHLQSLELYCTGLNPHRCTIISSCRVRNYQANKEQKLLFILWFWDIDQYEWKITLSSPSYRRHFKFFF